jgi:diadenosine tetraphosphate (Ap4A) HIT family hydrolase
LNETIVNFGYPDSVVATYTHWVVLLRPQQVTLGSLVLAATSQARNLHELDGAAFTELGRVVADIETTLQTEIGYQKINYLMLMMVDPHVHYHVIPRYESSKEFGGVSFEDQSWPGPPALNLVTPTTAELNEQLKAQLRGRWPA